MFAAQTSVSNWRWTREKKAEREATFTPCSENNAVPGNKYKVTPTGRTARKIQPYSEDPGPMSLAGIVDKVLCELESQLLRICVVPGGGGTCL